MLKGAGVFVVSRLTEDPRLQVFRVTIGYYLETVAILLAIQTMSASSAFTFWFTGLSGAGKSSLACALAANLRSTTRVIVLDGDEMRTGLCSDLGFSPESRTENVRRVAEVANLLNRNGIVAIAALISPLISDRALARRIIGGDRFAEVFVDASFEVCEQRDVKGLYKRARSGSIGSFSGLTAPYETPLSPDVHIRTESSTIEECVRDLQLYWARTGSSV